MTQNSDGRDCITVLNKTYCEQPPAPSPTHEVMAGLEDIFGTIAFALVMIVLFRSI